MSPSQEQIEQLRKNCYNISLWLDHTHDFLQDVVNEVYFKLSQDSSGDPGQNFISVIMNLGLAAIGDLDFPGAAITGFAIDSVISSFDTDTPEDLKKAFGDVWGRFGATFQVAEDDFGSFAADPTGNWDKQYTNSITGKSFKVGDLGDLGVFFPSRDPSSGAGFYNPDAFNKMTDSVKTAFRYNLAKNIMGKKWSILHQPNSNFWSNWNDNDAEEFAKEQILGNRDVFLTWYHDQQGSCAGCPSDGISTFEPRIGIGDWYSSWDYYHGGSAPRDLCDWLMQDDGFGTVLNPDALTTRRDVFYNWPINGNLNEHPDHSRAKTHQSDENVVSKESKKRAKGWHKLFAKKQRFEVEQDIIQKTIEKPKFLADLLKDPKSTLEAYLELPIPDEVKIEVIQEKPGDYKLVLPYIGRKLKKKKKNK